LWGVLVRHMRWGVRPSAEVAGLSMLLVALVVALLVWLVNPLTVLLALPALHLWLVLASPDALALSERSRRGVALVLVALGVLPLALLGVFYAHQLGLGVGEVVWTGVLLLAGGYVGVLGAILWSVAFGCVAVAVMLAFTSMPDGPGALGGERIEVTIRGPRTYAGPGSLGGTESALRL
jgi:hypothetical protein